MNFFQATLLGILEGFTEFLPISSTAHLLLGTRLLGLEETEFVKTFVIVIQFGAILAVVGLYLKRLLTDWQTNLRVMIAFIPTALIGFALYKVIKGFFFGEDWLILGSLFLGGVFLILFERWHKPAEGEMDLSTLSYKKAFLVGVIQAFAVIPGVSRSAATIVGGELLGFSRKAIVEFSFLLAIPTMFAATSYDLFKSAPSFSSEEFYVLAWGFLVSGVFAWISVKWLLNFIKKHSFAVFGFYRIALAIILGVIFFF